MKAVSDHLQVKLPVATQLRVRGVYTHNETNEEAGPTPAPSYQQPGGYCGALSTSKALDQTLVRVGFDQMAFLRHFRWPVM